MEIEEDKILGNSLALFGAMGFRVFTQLILNILIARYFSTVVYGQFHVAMTFFFIFSTFISFGLHHLIVREVSKDSTQATLYFWNAIYLKVFLLVISYVLIICYVTIFHYGMNLKFAVYLSSLALLPYSISHIIDSLIQAKKKMVYITLANFIYSIVYLVGGIIGLILDSNRILGVIIGFVIAHFFLMISYVHVWRRFLSSKLIPFKNSFILGKILPESVSFMGIAVLTSVFMRVDILMLSSLKNEQEVGIYGAAFKLVELGIWILASIAAATFPSLSQAYTNNKNRLPGIYARSVRLVIIVLSIYIFMCVLFGKMLLVNIFGSNYIVSVKILKILVWFLLPVGVMQLVTRVIFAAGKQVIALVFLFLSCVLNVSLNFCFIPGLGAWGAALATVISVMIHFLMIFIYCEKWIVSVGILRNVLLPVFIGTICLLTPALVFEKEPLTVHVLSLLFYLFILVKFKFVNIELLRYLYSRKK